jgi:hypothetical protein
MFRVAVRMAACGLLLAGCAARDPARALPSPPLAAGGPVSPDGVYNGMMQTVRGGELCGSSDSVVITVRGNGFRYVLYQPQVPEQRTRAFDVTIGEHGRFDAVDGPTFIRGTVGDGHMQGEIAGDACGYDFQADRTGTW